MRHSRIDPVEGIDLVLADEQTGDVLIVGRFKNPQFIAHCAYGEIFSRRYVLTSKAEFVYAGNESIVESLGIAPERVFAGAYPGKIRKSALQFPYAVPEHPDREIVERAIQSRL